MVTGPKATAGIFATYLPNHMTLWRGFLDEVSSPGWISFPKPPHDKEDKNILDRVNQDMSLLVHLDLESCGLTKVSNGLPRNLFPPGVPNRDSPAVSLCHHGQEQQPSTARDRGPGDWHPHLCHWDIPRHELRICYQPIPGPPSPLLHLHCWLG
jgi:hypothetical protein